MVHAERNPEVLGAFLGTEMFLKYHLVGHLDGRNHRLRLRMNLPAFGALRLERFPPEEVFVHSMFSSQSVVADGTHVVLVLARFRAVGVIVDDARQGIPRLDDSSNEPVATAVADFRHPETGRVVIAVVITVDLEDHLAHVYRLVAGVTDGVPTRHGKRLHGVFFEIKVQRQHLVISY